MHPFIARNLFYHPILFFRGEKVGRYHDEVCAFNRLGRSEMEEVQWAKLKRLLDHVYAHNRYYHDLFDQNRIHPDRIKSLEDYRRVPLLAKGIIQENSARLLSEGNYRLDHRKTSGSTGHPLKFVKDRVSLAYMNAVMHEVYHWHGIEIGDRSCRIWAIPKDSRKQLSIFLRDHLQNRRRLNSFDVSDESSLRFFRAMLKFRPKFMMGVPSYITDFAKRLRNASLNPADIGLDVIISTGEILYPAQKKLMEEAFACRIANEYGTSECGIVAFACPQGRMHTMNHNLLVEVINPETGAPVNTGERGEIVITELHGYYMPFIRYRLGDTVQLSSDICPCGLQSPLLEHVEGRLEDMIVTPSGKNVAGGMLYYTLTEGIHQFKAYQRAVDRLEVLIVKGPGFSETWLAEVKRQWHEYLGEDMKFDFRFVDRIPADRSGKLRYFVPEFDPDYIEPPPTTGSNP
jgi:phenylacetate-CoA ligase